MNERLPALKSREVIRALERAGLQYLAFQEVTAGSFIRGMRLERSRFHCTVVPI
jgi:hypothetical protein